MKCPLTYEVVIDEEVITGYAAGECLKEECGQWDKDKGMCSRVSQTVELRLIRALLKDIRDKMPREEQLRRNK